MLKLKLQYFGHLIELTHWKRPWCLEGLGAEGEGDARGWDGWMASPTRWTWVWVNSWSRWWTGRPGVLWFMGLQRVGHDWATELDWTEVFCNYQLVKVVGSVVQITCVSIFVFFISFCLIVFSDFEKGILHLSNMIFELSFPAFNSSNSCFIKLENLLFSKIILQLSIFRNIYS